MLIKEFIVHHDAGFWWGLQELSCNDLSAIMNMGHGKKRDLNATKAKLQKLNMEINCCCLFNAYLLTQPTK